MYFIVIRVIAARLSILEKRDVTIGYASVMTICNVSVQLAANIWHYPREIVDNLHFGPISPPF